MISFFRKKLFYYKVTSVIFLFLINGNVSAECTKENIDYYLVKKKSKIALVANRGRDYTNIYWELDDFLEGQKIPFLTMVRDSQNYIRGAEKGLGIMD